MNDAERLFNKFREPGEKYWYELDPELRRRWEKVACEARTMTNEAKLEAKRWEGYDGR